MRASLLALALVSSVAGAAHADEPVVRADGVVVMPVTEVVGRRQAPGVIPVLSRARMRYEAPELERHATSAIVESVRHAPF